MSSLHRFLLNRAVRAAAPHSAELGGASICITGASGFLAASLVAFLSELNRIAQLDLRIFASARRPLAEVPLFPFLGLSPEVHWDLAAVEDVQLPDAGPLIIVHTASYGSPQDYLREPLATFQANTHGLLNLYGQKKLLRQFVYFSSPEIYGQPPPSCIPTPETYLGGPDPLSPRSIYAESKRMAETLGACLSRRDGAPFVALRPWHVYGPGQRPSDGRAPVDFVRQARVDRSINLTSDGTPTRCFCHAWDAILQITAVLGRAIPTSALNIGHGREEVSMLSTAQRCASACGLPTSSVRCSPTGNASALQRCAPDVSAITRLTPYAPPPASLDEGIATLVEWLDFSLAHP